MTQPIKDGKLKKEKPLPAITEDEIPYVIILTKGFEVTGKKNSVAAKGYPMQVKAVPEDSVAYKIINTASYQ